MYRAGKQYYWELRGYNEGLHDAHERIHGIPLHAHMSVDRPLARAAALGAIMFDGMMDCRSRGPTSCTPVSFFFSTLMMDHTGDKLVSRARIGMWALRWSART